jgi:glycosyltransferase involved in cell wall biosynthesis
MKQPLLSVCLITYNHVKYINEAIEGVLMQKVNFAFNLIIADDCSTDGTREILIEYRKKYPRFIKLILQNENIGAAKNWLNLIDTPQSKYIAYFEGDDYWIDPLKLQTQIDFLETNYDYGMVCTDYNTLEGNHVVEKFLSRKRGMIKDEDITIEKYLINSHKIRSLTTCFKRELITSFVVNHKKEVDKFRPAAGDVPLWLHIAANSKIRYLAITTSVYRITANTASRPDTFYKKYEFSKSVVEIKRRYTNINPVSWRVKRKIEKTFLLNELAHSYFNHNLKNLLKINLTLLCHLYFSRKSIFLLFGLLNNKLYVQMLKKYDLV